MECPECKKTYNDSLALFAIQKLNRCPPCNKKWAARPENNPDFKKFEIEYEIESEDYAIIYAKNRKEAEEQFEENYMGEYLRIVEVREVQKKQI